MQDRYLSLSYSSSWGFYWMSYAAMSSFASAFLLGRGYSNSEIGVIIAAANVLAMFLQPVTADIADRSRKVSIISITNIMTIVMMLITFGILVIGHRGVALMIFYVLLLSFNVCLQPLLNQLNFKLEECGARLNFGVCRAGGSLCYAVLCMVLGTLVERLGITTLPVTAEIMFAMLIVSLGLTNRKFKELAALRKNPANQEPSVKMDATDISMASTDATKNASGQSDDISFKDFIAGNKLFVILNAAILLMYLHAQVLNSFMLQIVKNVGGTSVDMGRIFAFCAFLEMPTMIAFDWVNRRIKCATLLEIAAVAFVLKILMFHIARNVYVLYAASILQTFSFGLLLPGMVKFTAQKMKPGEQTRGQALFTMIMTLATIISSLIGGVILDLWGASTLTLLATITTAIGAAAMIAVLEKFK